MESLAAPDAALQSTDAQFLIGRSVRWREFRRCDRAAPEYWRQAAWRRRRGRLAYLAIGQARLDTTTRAMRRASDSQEFPPSKPLAWSESGLPAYDPDRKEYDQACVSFCVQWSRPSVGYRFGPSPTVAVPPVSAGKAARKPPGPSGHSSRPPPMTPSSPRPRDGRALDAAGRPTSPCRLRPGHPEVSPERPRPLRPAWPSPALVRANSAMKPPRPSILREGFRQGGARATRCGPV